MQPTPEEINEYTTLKVAIADLEARAEVLQKKILADLIQSGAEGIKTDAGNLSVGQRKKWLLPNELVEREINLKADIEVAKRIGTAVFENVPYLTFRSKKEEATV